MKMKGLANYMILPEFRLILECCKGKASVEDAICMKKAELSDSLYNPDFNKDLSTNLGAFKIEVFSTAEAAIRYLGFSIENADLIKKKIVELNDAIQN